MKLRYYMRGLGIGMLVTALVLILSGNIGKGMTDEDVKKRALELGMVENTKEVLSDMESAAEKSAQSTDSESETEDVDVQTSKVTEASEKAVETQPEEKTESQQKVEETPKEVLSEEEQKKNEVEALKKAAEEVAQKAQNLNPNGVVTLLIQGGDSSVAVAKRAEAAGLVESATEFDRFLCQNGYDKFICVGSYEIPMDATQEEIAKIIMKRQ